MHPTLITIVAYLTAAALSATRILVATRPIWGKLPATVQVVLPLAIPALATLVQELAGVKTGIDLTTAIIGAVLMAVPGLPSNRSAAPLQAGKESTREPSAGDVAVAESLIAKASVAPPPTSETKLPPMFPGAGALLLVVCAFHANACAPSKPPCDQAKLAAVVTICTAKSQECVNEGKSKSECEALSQCDLQIEQACSGGNK